MTETRYIFIVGMPRTGSTLTRHILNRSNSIGLGGESHYLSDLPRLGFQARRGVRSRINRMGDLSTEEGLHQVSEYLYTEKHRHFTYWNFQDKDIDRDTFLERLRKTDRSDRALFDLSMEIHAKGKAIRGEKTPAHIFWVPQLLEWFPSAKIIHTFRDPRAIYVSRKKKAASNLRKFNASLRRLGVGFELISSLHVILFWQRMIRLHDQYQNLYPDCYMLSRYEDLICNPVESMEKLCTFLDIELEDSMLNQTVINSSYTSDGIPGFDTSSVDRWKGHIDPLVNRWFINWCKPQLQRFGYET